MQVTVYIPVQLEEKVRALSRSEGKSLQQVLLDPFRGEMPKSKIEERLDRIEERVVDIFEILYPGCGTWLWHHKKGSKAG